MNTDVKICHVTKPGANLFAELGFEPAEAAQFQAELRQQIDQTQALKRQLMEELVSWIGDTQLKQAEVAEILKVSRPRVSDVVNMKMSKFTIDALVGLLGRAGKAVRLAVG
jgi:predicted XRE-type DNA-binding protein